MAYPMLPPTAAGEVLLVCTCYEQGSPRWEDVLAQVGGRRHGDVVLLGDDGTRLRLVDGRDWEAAQPGSFPARVPEGSAAPVVAIADSSAVYGGESPLLVDLREVPGRGARVATEDLDRVLIELSAGTRRFDELVEEMDRYGVYLGDGGEMSVPTPTAVIRTSFPQLPFCDATLVVRTDFGDPEAWASFAQALAESDDDLMPVLIVDDRAFESLQPGQVPALIPYEQYTESEWTTMVVLADAEAMTDPERPLLVVDLYDTPGQVLRIPLSEAGSLAANLLIGNMDFNEFG